MILICELATSHGGDVGLAVEMIHAAKDAGADYAKVQTYSLERLNPRDPQAAWLRQAWLSPEAHDTLIEAAADAGIQFLSTPFDAGSLTLLRHRGLTTFKIASSESANGWWEPKRNDTWFVSYPWGARRHTVDRSGVPLLYHPLTAIPLYPTPLECVGRATLLDGWSDHGDGIDACLWAIAQGVQVLEVHMTLGKGRVTPWDKTPDQVRELRRFAEACETMRSGVAQRFRERWQR